MPWTFIDRIGLGSQEATTRFPAKPATKAQKNLINKIRAAPALPKSNRGVYKKQRSKLLQTAANVKARQAFVAIAIKEIETVKCLQESVVLVGKRRRVAASAKDVCVWLVTHHKGKFSAWTVTRDMRVLKKEKKKFILRLQEDDPAQENRTL